MSETSTIVTILFKRFHAELTEEEQHTLDVWLAASAHNRAFFHEINDEERLRALLLSFREEKREQSEKRVLNKLQAQLFPSRTAETDVPVSAPVHRIHFLKTAWFKYAAAILLVVTGIALYYNLFPTPPPGNKVVQTVPPVSGNNDVPPGSNRAVLTLSSGQQVELDSASSATIKDGTLSIDNNNGQLSYTNASVAAINTMTTPKGGQYQLTLADGTKVWLNAASSITYPTAFTGTTREVTITGEAYFEVAKNKGKPFLVKTAKEDVTVVGTSFNVSAYPDEPVFKTSLIEGSIRIHDKVLQPGQAFTNGKVVTTDVEQDIAWKNGYFHFDGADLPAVMRQLERWYAIEVQYDRTIPQLRLRGKMQRELTLQQVLEVLQEMHVQFRIEGNTLFVE